MKNTLLLVLTLFTLTVQAQNNEADTTQNKVIVVESNNRFMVYWGTNYNNQNFSQLNNTLSNLGSMYEVLPKNVASWNLGWVFEDDLVLVKTNIGFGNAIKGKKGKRNTRLSYFSSSIELGLNFSKNNNNIRIYPTAGLGVAVFTATINKDLSNINFNDILQNPNIQATTTPTRLTNTFFVYRAGFAVDFFNKKNNNQAIGLFAGYSGSFSKRAWKLNMEQQVGNAPSDGLSQFYAGINLLMQSRKSRKK
ncbi:MAG: hypothetical protein MUE72_07210 [Chitinophagaceae bacterium]|jgi:hypothetical protein|nr:hypothetical protein [Chitinophagaceae bacterium]